MRAKLTRAVADRAKSRDIPHRIYDTQISGFSLRIQPSGRKSWVLQVKRKTYTLGQYPVMSVVLAREKVQEILLGNVPMQNKRIPTLGEFIEEYYKDFAETNYANPKESISHLIRTGFSGKCIDAIRVIDIEQYRTKRLNAGIAPSSINRQLAILKAALQKAVEWEILQINPLMRFKQLKLDAMPVVRYLSQNEAERLGRALEDSTPWLRSFTVMALNTGLRRAELWNLVWGDIDLRKGVLTVQGIGSKSKQTRHIPLNDKALDVLAQWRGSVIPLKTMPVFGRHEFRKSWKTLMSKAQIEDFTFHYCRHTFASKLVMAGVPLNTVRELLGHASITMTLRYAHLADDTKRDAVNML